MKLYQTYKKVISLIKPVQTAWFTTFNLDPELIEKFLLPCIVDKEPTDLVTAEDFEALNVDLQDKDRNIDVKIWYDYRALNFRNNKRTTIDLFPVDPSILYNVNKTAAIFHPKVIFLKGSSEAYLITGSFNLSIAAWSSNRESVIVKRIDDRKNANNVISFFKGLGANTSKLIKWADSMKKKEADWHFIYSLSNEFNLFDHIEKGDLSVWSPYFSANTDKFIKSLQKKGYKKITLIPDVPDNGRIRILSDDLELLNKNSSVSICKSSDYDESQPFHHAKVWLTSNSLAVGSWNCTYPATGLDIADTEKNVEAGIVVTSNKLIEKSLRNNLVPLKLKNIPQYSEEDMDTEWKEVLNPFTYCINIIADWEKFTYVLDNISLENKCSVSLPDSPNEKILLKNINGRSFLKNYRRVLKDKSFTVYDSTEKEVYKGYLLEYGKKDRPVYGYGSLSDLLDSLINDPLGETTHKRCQYRLPNEEDNNDDPMQSIYSGSESYYLMFVSFQKLLDNIEKISGDQKALDYLGFRLPGSIINIISLVNESLQNTLKGHDQDNFLYHYFLVCEVNSCVSAFNEFFDGKKIDLIDISRLKKMLGFNLADERFLNKIKKDFGYVNV